jgi:cation:H+ antiporter
MILHLAAILVGFGLLVWGADRFVIGAAALARNLGVQPLLIGLTVVGFGTSAPEILVSGTAAVQGNPGLAVGNAVGSNIANIGLILGFTAVLVPLAVRSDTLRREYPLLLTASIVTWLLLADGRLGRLDGVILLVGLVLAMVLVVRIGLARGAGDPLLAEYEAEIPRDVGTPVAVAWLVAGLIILVLSSRLLVWGAVNVAQAFGVSDLVIGLTIVAVGTSLPELAASVASAFKKEHDIAIGNVIGSNLYNLLAVLSLPGLIAPGAVSADVLERDLPVMMLLTAALYVMGRGFSGPGRINRFEGLLLLAAFIGYQWWVIRESLGTAATGVTG